MHRTNLQNSKGAGPLITLEIVTAFNVGPIVFLLVFVVVKIVLVEEVSFITGNQKLGSVIHLLWTLGMVILLWILSSLVKEDWNRYPRPGTYHYN